MAQPRHLELLHDAMFGFARAMLDRFGEFHPFGGYLLPSGQVVQVSFDRPLRADSIDALASALGELDADATAHALVVDTQLSAPRDGMQDAVRLFLAHVDGHCVDMVMPYHACTGAPTRFGQPFGARGPTLAFRRRR